VISEKFNYVDIPVLIPMNIYPFLNVFAGSAGFLYYLRKYEFGLANTDTSTEVI